MCGNLGGICNLGFDPLITVVEIGGFAQKRQLMRVSFAVPVGDRWLPTLSVEGSGD